MFSPELLETAGDSVAAVYNDIEAKMLTHLVSSLIYIEDLDQRTVTELNLLAQSHTEKLRGYIEAEAEVIDEKVRETAERLLRASDTDDLKRVGTGTAMWPQQVNATVEGVARILARDNLQMVEGAKQAFLSASVEAVTRVNTGTMTTERALHAAVRKLERDGIPIITYQNSKTGMVTVENKVDVAVRRHIRTQIAQDGARMTMERIEACDVTLVEVSSHEDSRESHALWQGQVYSLKGEVEIDGHRYRDFYAATGYGSVDGLMGANCRHSFGPYRHGAPRAYQQNPKHPSGLSGAEIYELEQTQRYLERRIREAKREVRGAQQVYEKLGDLESRSALAKAQAKLKDSQSAMRGLIKEANAKAKPGTTVLTRKPNREWAGDMPKTTNLKASGRKLDAFLGGDGVKAQMKAKGLSVAKVRDSIKAQLKAKGGTAADFSTLTASDQQGMFRRALDALSGTAKAQRGKHASPFSKIKGEHTREQDAMATNPNFKPNDPLWGKNCQRCVSAYEARRRGYDVTALPRVVDGSDRLQYMRDPKGWPQVYKDPELIKCASNSGIGTMGKVESKMAAWGDGARAIVRVQWQDKYGGGGHVFVAEQVNGRTVFIDPQSGTMDCSSHFALVKKNQTFVMRVDDREFTDLLFECCKEAKK